MRHVGYFASSINLGSTDPYWADVVLLVPGTGYPGSTTLVDISNTHNLITAGGATISSAQSKFGSGSIVFNNAATAIINAVSTLALGANDFTIEFWAYGNAWTGTTSLVGGVAGAVSISMYYTTGLGVGEAAVKYITHTPSPPPLSTWTFIAVTKSSGSIRIFIDGVLQASASDITNFYGQINTIGGSYSGYMNELRITAGVARYTSNFTVPTAPFPTNGNVVPTDPYYPDVSLLLHGNGVNDGASFPDASLNTFACTPETAITTTTQSKFGGSSMYFNGDPNTCLVVPASTNWSFGISDFTVECWVYINTDSPPDGTGNRRGGLVGPNGSTMSRNWGFWIEGDTASTGTGLFFECYFPGGSANRVISVPVTKFVWHHVSISRTTSGFYFSLDGVVYQTAVIGDSVGLDSGMGLNIGRDSGISSYQRPLNGFINDFRITNGYARYTSNFIVPTAPFPGN